jgi:hypothetical protein
VGELNLLTENQLVIASLTINGANNPLKDKWPEKINFQQAINLDQLCYKKTHLLSVPLSSDTRQPARRLKKRLICGTIRLFQNIFEPGG